MIVVVVVGTNASSYNIIRNTINMTNKTNEQLILSVHWSLMRLGGIWQLVTKVVALLCLKDTKHDVLMCATTRQAHHQQVHHDHVGCQRPNIASMQSSKATSQSLIASKAWRLRRRLTRSAFYRVVVVTPFGCSPQTTRQSSFGVCAQSVVTSSQLHPQIKKTAG